jgi:hypothetical protein
VPLVFRKDFDVFHATTPEFCLSYLHSQDVADGIKQLSAYERACNKSARRFAGRTRASPPWISMRRTQREQI